MLFVVPERRPAASSTLFPYTPLFRSRGRRRRRSSRFDMRRAGRRRRWLQRRGGRALDRRTRLGRSEEHTSELQSRRDLVCRLLLEKKKKDFSRKGSPFQPAAGTPRLT